MHKKYIKPLIKFSHFKFFGRFSPAELSGVPEATCRPLQTIGASVGKGDWCRIILMSGIDKTHAYHANEELPFSSTLDSGYYNEWKNTAKKGAFSVSVQIDEMYFRKYLDLITHFGFCFSDSKNEINGGLMKSEEILTLKNRNGSFNAVIFNISEDNFDKKVYVRPFIVVASAEGETMIFGKPVSVKIYQNGIKNSSDLRLVGKDADFEKSDCDI
ncbi:MAG: hypothetical protein J6C82_02010 [Clostridia bacterium]|nr:hypothetical protein [Clostridia bacterium]